MSSFSRTISKVAGSVAAIASFIPGGQVVAAVAGVVSLATGIIGGQPSPQAQGSTSDVVITSDHPAPYMIGRTYAGGVMRYDRGYGQRRRRVENPYRYMVMVYSRCGPCEGIESLQVDYAPVNFSGKAAQGFYNDFLFADTQLGARPETNALTPQWAGAPGWTTASRLSGYLAVGWSLLFDRDGERFANGPPRLGIIGLGERAYDPRKDSTYAGGEGDHRIDNEATWEYTENPSLHALSYAIGRRQNGFKIFGAGSDFDAIDVATFVAFANVCDANGWKVGGTIYEPGDKWDNLKRILGAAGAEPKLNGTTLTVKYDAPRVPVFTITADDLTSTQVSMVSGGGQRERFNTVVLQYRSEAHNWEFIDADPVTDLSFVVADGEERTTTDRLELCQQGKQAAEVAGYRLLNSREGGPYTLPLKPRFQDYHIGECGVIADEEGLGFANQKVIIEGRQIDIQTGGIILVLRTETDEKHPFALGQTTTAPPTPTPFSSEQADRVAASAMRPVGFDEELIRNSNVTGLSFTRTTQGASVDVTLSAHSREYGDKTVAVNEATMTGLTPETFYYFYYDDESRTGGDVAIISTINSGIAYASSTNPDRHFVGQYRTPDFAGEGGSGSGPPPPGIGPTPNIE